MFRSLAVEWTFAMLYSVHARRLEFDDVVLDLSRVVFTVDPGGNEEYIVFLNLKRAFFKNFIVACDMSLETLALHLYQTASLTVAGVAPPRAPGFAEHISFNASDRDQSIIVDLAADARLVVARRLRSNEWYHQRASGFADFQRRHEQPAAPVESDLNKRNVMDRELEITLYTSELLC
ncbi:hypothetical protein [Samia ricini nucleopolyhedrovirus]|nr:hypothetical protein [Samia ricini nucleopolyhedrovirus]BBD51310.1 hypothetical protein [Samia ricini nucleopolyhedrovirus]BBD51462.1 hypothetical protein [Samia ricini nucleopolyhedrovirus]